MSVSQPEGAKPKPKRPKGQRPGSARGDVLVAVAFSFGMIFIVLGLCLALSALPPATRQAILFIGNLFPASSQHASVATQGQDALFFLGFGLMSLGMGMILAHGFAERHRFTYLGISFGGTIAIAVLFFAGWKLITEPPAFRYALIKFACSKSVETSGTFRLRVNPSINHEQRQALEAALLELERQEFNYAATKLAIGPATDHAPEDDSRIRKVGNEYYLPAMSGGELPLPTLHEADHTVTAEWVPAEIEPASIASEDIAVEQPSRGADLRYASNKYTPFMRLKVTPKATAGRAEFSLRWRPQILEADIYIDEIQKIMCAERPSPASQSIAGYGPE